MSSSRVRSQSWRKQQRHFTQQQPAYLVQYVQQLYVAAIGPNFNQQQVPVYQPVQQTSIYQPIQVSPTYQQAPAALTYQQPKVQAPRQNAPPQTRR